MLRRARRVEVNREKQNLHVDAALCMTRRAFFLGRPSWILTHESSLCATCPNCGHGCRSEVCAGNPIVTRTTRSKSSRRAATVFASVHRSRRGRQPQLDGNPDRLVATVARSFGVTLRRRRHPGVSVNSPRPSRSAFDPRSGPCGRSRHWACRADAKSTSPGGRPAR